MKLRPPFENEELGDRAADALHEITHYGGDPKLVLANFLDSLEITLKSYLNEVFGFAFDWLELELWQLLPTIEELAMERFAEDEQTEQSYWVRRIQDIAEYCLSIEAIASKVALSELPEAMAREYAVLILGSVTLSSRLCEKPYDHDVSGPKLNEFRILYGPYPLVENMAPGSLAGDMAAVIESSREIVSSATSDFSEERKQELSRLAEVISRAPLAYAEQYSCRPHTNPEPTEEIASSQTTDLNFHPSQTKTFIRYIREARDFIAITRKYGDLPDTHILAISAIKYAYLALRELQDLDYRPWSKASQEHIDQTALAARVCKQRLDKKLALDQAGKNLASKRKDYFKAYYERLTAALRKEYSHSEMNKHPDRVRYRHIIAAKIARDFQEKGLAYPDSETRRKWFERRKDREFHWASWDKNHNTWTGEEFIPERIVRDKLGQNS